ALYALRYLIGAVMLAVLVFLVCWLVVPASSPWRETADSLCDWLYPLLLGAVPAMIILIPLMPFVRARKLFKIKGIEGERVYVFSDEGIKITTALGSASLKWGVFSLVKETRRYVFLFSGPYFANIIPKRCFVDARDIEQFRSLVRSHATR